jgi:hypothetical protein
MLLSRFKIQSLVILCLVFVTLSVSAQAQQIILLDSGVDSDLGFNLGEGFNYFDNTTDTSDASGETQHGNLSAYAITESFLGPIIPLVVTDAQFNFEQETIARDNALSDALGRDEARVIAVTWGRPGITGSSAPLIPQLSNADKVILIMAGNDSAAQPNALATSSFNLPGAIIVGASDADGNILDTTSRAGTTQNRYVLINGLSPNDPDSGGGSSWATARGAGMAAAVLQQNPQLTNEEVAQVILLSATDVGEAGVDAINGRGFIADVDQVLNNPIGPLAIPEPTPEAEGGGSSGGGSSGGGLIVGAAVVGAVLVMRKPSEKLEKTLVLDSYGRGFHIDLNDYIQVRDGSLNLSDIVNGMEQDAITEQLSSVDGHTVLSYSMSSQTDFQLDMVDYFSMQGDSATQSSNALGSFKFQQSFDNGFDYRLGYQASNGVEFGVPSVLNSKGLKQNSAAFLSGNNFGSLLSGFASRSDFFGIGYGSNKAKGLKVSANLVSAKENQDYGLDSTSSLVNVSYEFSDNAALVLQVGELQENGSLFGGASGGVFGVDNARTQAMNLGTQIKFSDHLQMVANYGIGRTKVDSSVGGFLSEFTSLKSDWYSIGLIANKIFSTADQLGFAVSKPLQFSSGSATFSVPTARDYSGKILFDSSRIDLSETGATEHVLDLYYRNRIGKRTDVGVYFSYRHNPNHTDVEDDEAILLATLRYSL